MNPNKLKNIESLSPQDRYGYFIRKVADFQEVWLIHDNGQNVLLGDNEEQMAIPVWPEKEFAELMLRDDWKDYKIEGMEILHFIDLLDKLEKEGYKIAGFPLMDLSCTVVRADEMKNHLLHEMQQYE